MPDDMKMPEPTPRTDALMAKLAKDSGCEPEGNDLVVIEFLKTMERELNKSNKELTERLELVQCLARRICRDLRHATDSIQNPEDRKIHGERYKGFSKILGDTVAYRHRLHKAIEAAEQRAERAEAELKRYENSTSTVAQGKPTDTSVERDAMRYRWLRSRINYRDEERRSSTSRTSETLVYRVRCWRHDSTDFTNDTIDAAIDAALKEKS